MILLNTPSNKDTCTGRSAVASFACSLCTLGAWPADNRLRRAVFLHAVGNCVGSGGLRIAKKQLNSRGQIIRNKCYFNSNDFWWIHIWTLTHLIPRVSSETSFVSYFAKHETKQVSCFAKQTCRFAKFRFEAKLAVSHVSLFFKRNETARFACFVTFFKKICRLVAAGSGKSAYPTLHQEPPHIKNRSDASGVGIAYRSWV
jgi:hypothetical protein